MPKVFEQSGAGGTGTGDVTQAQLLAEINARSEGDTAVAEAANNAIAAAIAQATLDLQAEIADVQNALETAVNLRALAVPLSIVLPG